jgi:hypothetical protein
MTLGNIHISTKQACHWQLLRETDILPSTADKFQMLEEATQHVTKFLVRKFKLLKELYNLCPHPKPFKPPQNTKVFHLEILDEVKGSRITT